MTGMSMTYLAISAVTKRQREIVALEQTDVLTNFVHQRLTFGTFLHIKTISVAHDTADPPPI